MRWILVAGSGQRFGLAKEVVWLARAIGASLAEKNYGLVVGGWHGVDYLAASAFSDELQKTQPMIRLSDVMLQVVPRGKRPVFQGGRIVTVEPGPSEWVEALRFAEAVILIGGIGGTYRTYAYAMQERRAVFPIVNSGGDAATVFKEMGQRWHASGVWGVSHSQFCKVLSQNVASYDEARRISDNLMILIDDHIGFQNTSCRRSKLFVSYARTDGDWLKAIKIHLRALPEQVFTVWDDTDIPAGAPFEREIQSAMSTSRGCLLLVTPDFLSSAFIRERELPFLFRAHENGLMRIFWLHIRKAPYENTRLADIQAAHDPKRPLADMTPSERQEVLARVCLQIAKYIRDAISESEYLQN